MPDQREDLVRKMIAEGTSDEDIRATLKVFDAQQAKSPALAKPFAAEDFIPNKTSTLREGAKGIVKGAIHSGIDLASSAAQSGLIPGLSTASLPPQVTEQARERTAYRNTPQQVGGALETAAELAVPLIKGAQAVPTTAKAAAKFQGVLRMAKDVPVNVEEPGQVALRIQELADRGGSMPMAVRKLVGRITDPSKPPIAYEEARDFASNISRLSANERQRLTPVIQREVGNLRVALNKANERAAATVGKGGDYASAMKEYAQAMGLKDTLGAVGQGVKHALPYAVGGGAAGGGYWMAKKLLAMLGE